MICYCGKPVWEYDPETWTCKDGHHTAIAGAVTERLTSPEPPPPKRYTLTPGWIAFLSGAGTSIALFIAEHVF